MFDIKKTAKNLIDGIVNQRRMTHSGVVLTSCAILDNQLERAIKNSITPMSENIYKRLFEDSSGPLNTFSNKIVMAYALGIIPSEIFIELEKIRRIRNEFAHSSKLLNFESPQIAPKFLELVKPQTTKKDLSEIYLECVIVIDKFLDEFILRTSEKKVEENDPMNSQVER